MPRRMGRPGLMGTMARTAVIAGTATAVSGRVQQRQYERATAGQAEAPAEAAAPLPPPPAAPAAPAADDPIAKIRELGELNAQGLLSDDEFAAAKAKLLGI